MRFMIGIFNFSYFSFGFPYPKVNFSHEKLISLDGVADPPSSTGSTHPAVPERPMLEYQIDPSSLGRQRDGLKDKKEGKKGKRDFKKWEKGFRKPIFLSVLF